MKSFDYYSTRFMYGSIKIASFVLILLVVLSLIKWLTEVF